MHKFRKNVRRYLIVTVVFFCCSVILTGTVTVYERTEYNLTGEMYKVFSASWLNE